MNIRSPKEKREKDQETKEDMHDIISKWPLNTEWSPKNSLHVSTNK